MSVVVQGLTPDTNEVQLREFFSYCGDIANVLMHAVDANTGLKSATVVFVRPESLDIAELLSGAAINGSAIHVVASGGVATAPHPAEGSGTGRVSAVGAVDGLSADGLLRGGKEILTSIRQKATALDTKYGIRDHVVAGARVVKDKVGGAVDYVTGRNDTGVVQIACWYWKPHQPQWGPDPKLDAARRQGASLPPAL